MALNCVVLMVLDCTPVITYPLGILPSYPALYTMTTTVHLIYFAIDNIDIKNYMKYHLLK